MRLSRCKKCGQVRREIFRSTGCSGCSVRGWMQRLQRLLRCKAPWDNAKSCKVRMNAAFKILQGIVGVLRASQKVHRDCKVHEDRQSSAGMCDTQHVLRRILRAPATMLPELMDGCVFRPLGAFWGVVVVSTMFTLLPGPIQKLGQCASLGGLTSPECMAAPLVSALARRVLSRKATFLEVMPSTTCLRSRQSARYVCRCPIEFTKIVQKLCLTLARFSLIS